MRRNFTAYKMKKCFMREIGFAVDARRHWIGEIFRRDCTARSGRRRVDDHVKFPW